MSAMFLRSLKLTNFLSFGPASQEIELKPLNVLIGPNASGKSNFIEAIELLHATPTNLAEAIRIGGTAEEWLWKGASPAQPAIITARLWSRQKEPGLFYRLAFTEDRGRIEIIGEAWKEGLAPGRRAAISSFTAMLNGKFTIKVKAKVKNEKAKREYVAHTIKAGSLTAEQSIFLSANIDLYPELTHVAEHFGRIQIFREWGFGRSAALRQAQPANCRVMRCCRAW